MMDDLISRQAALEAVKRHTFRLTFAEEQNCEGHVAWSAEAVYSEVMEGALLNLPSVQQPIDVQEAYYRGKVDGVRECTARLKKVNEELENG